MPARASAAATITGVVITRRRPDRLRLTLTACQAHDPPLDEIVVVDDDGTLDRGDLPAHPAGRVPLVLVAGGGRGRAAARNAGARRARGEWLLFLDDDVLTGPSFVAAHRAALQRRPGLCRGRIRELIAAALVKDWSAGAPGFPPLDEPRLRGGFDPRGYRQMASPLERAVEARFLAGRTALPAWLAAGGANFSIPRREWERLGGQDERFGLDWGCEDLEFSLRAVRAGVPVAYVPEAPGFHLSHARPDRWRQHAKSLALFARLHPAVEVAALDRLLGPAGSIDAYVEACGIHKRSAAG